MDTQQAIEYMNNQIGLTLNTDFIEIATEALEKQTPKLVFWTPSHQSYFSAGDEAESYCPICDENVLEDDSFYCKKCGQLLLYREDC